MQLLDLLSRRWALRVLWELQEGPRTSRSLRESIEVSPTVLQSRVNELRDARIIELQRPAGYALTPLGVELSEAFAPLYDFAGKWAKSQPEADDA